MDWSARSIGLRVGGHRGTSARAPENTVAAFELSVADGAVYVETDIRETADGALVVMHDATVDRTTDGQGPIAGLSLAEVLRLDAGAWYAPDFRGQRVMQFDEFLRWVEGRRGFGAAIEVKAAGIGGEVARRAWASPSREHFAIYSFLPNEIVAAKAAAPDLPCVLLLRLDDDPALVVHRVSACHGDGADVPWQWNAIDLITAMRDRNWLVGGGSAAGDQAARELLDLGVDMIDTDDPAAMLATAGRLRAD